MSLKVHFTPNKNDYIQASRLMAIKTPVFIVLAVLTIAIMAGSLIGLVFQWFTDSTGQNVAIVSLVIGAFYVLYYFLLTPLQLTKAIKKNEALQMKREFSFSEAEVDLKVGSQTSRLFWDHFLHVLKGRTMYILVYEEEKKMYPFLPKRALTEPGSEEAFLALLEEHNIPVK